MSNVPDSIKQEVERDVYGALHIRYLKELEDAENAMESWKSVATGLRHKLEYVEGKIAELTAPVTPKAQVGEGGRVKKGQTKQLVAEFLKAANGAGATIQQIMDAVHTTLSSTRRALIELDLEEKADQDTQTGRWKWSSSKDVTAY